MLPDDRKRWYVVVDTSQQDELGRGPTGIAISPYEDDPTDAIAWMQEGTVEDAELMANAREMRIMLWAAREELFRLKRQEAERRGEAYMPEGLVREISNLVGCELCGGTGQVDSGGVTPWGAGINLPCLCISEPET
jgi:hypothetical protein